MSIQDKLKSKEVLDSLILIKLACLKEDLNIENISLKIENVKEKYSIDLPDLNVEDAKKQEVKK